MKEYDVVVIGSGSGLSIVSKALKKNLRIALVAEKYLGGTCFNVGCVPSKTLIYAADRVLDIEESAKFGVVASISSIDFAAIMERTRNSTSPNLSICSPPCLSLYPKYSATWSDSSLR